MPQVQQAQASEAAQEHVLTMNVDDVENFASESVTAFVAFDRTVSKASLTKMEAVKEAALVLPKGMTGADYDRLCRKAVKASLALAVKRGEMEDGTASKVASQLKTVALALANGIKPEDGQGFVPFYNECVTRLASDPTLAHVYGSAPKAGAPAGTASTRKGTGRKGASSGAQVPAGEPASGNATPANRDPMLAAALILTRGQETRAAKLVTVMQSFVTEFDKWTGTILEAPAKQAPAKQAA
jgi:hypothetical protein